MLDEFIWGRGACDTKGIIASMITATEALVTNLDKEVKELALAAYRAVDGAGYAPCSDPLQLSGLADGPHSVSVRATDAGVSLCAGDAL